MVRFFPFFVTLIFGCIRVGFETPHARQTAFDASAGNDIEGEFSTWSDFSSQRYAGSLQFSGSGPIFRLLFGMANNTISPLPTAFIKELEINVNTNDVIARGSVTTKPVDRDRFI